MTTYPNWFGHYARAYFERHLTPLAGKPDLQFLQIGVFTGDASLWLVENILTGVDSVLVDIDTWEGSGEPEHEPFDWADVERTYDERLGWPPKPEKVKAASVDYLRAESGYLFDFVYIDGDHTAAGVLADAVHAFAILKPGGLLAFDDYRWKPTPDAPEHLAPALAIDAFLACYVDRLDILETGLQVWVRKR